ncbi:MAG: hypothetical protein JNM81_07175 [Rhodospirillaceae bacterium]|nr:hypothetical protein [Rhodospirillaceae bacterium]
MIPSGTVRVTLVFGLALIALILAAALLAPRMIDMRSAVPMIAADLSRALGQPVQVRGDALLSLVPAPRLIVRDVATVPGDPLTLNADEVRADLAWGDLLLGNYSISTLELVRPVLDLPITGLDVAAELPRLSITRGQVKIRNRENTFALEAVEAEVLPQPNGGLAWSASGILDGLVLETEGRIGVRSKAGAQNMQATIKLPEADVALDISGVQTADKGFAGRATVTALHACDVMTLSRVLDLPPQRWPIMREPLKAQAELVAVGDGVTLSQGELALADQTAAFGATFSMGAQPTFSVAAELRNIDLAPWLPAGPKQPAPIEPKFLDKLLVTAAPWQGDIKINGLALRLGDQILRDFALDVRAAPDQTGLPQTAIRNAAITLPGQTRLSFAGLWNDDAEALDGTWRVLSADLRSLLAWGGLAADTLPAGHFSSLSATGLVQAGDRLFALDDVSIEMDGSQATGRIAFGLGSDAPTTINLDIDRLALDVYGPFLAGVATVMRDDAPLPTAQSDSYGVKPLTPWLAALSKQRGNVRIAIKQASWKDALSGSFGLDLALSDGAADIRSLAFEDASGLALWMGGKVRSLGGVPQAEGVQVDAKIADVPRFVRSLGGSIPQGLRVAGPWSLTGTVSGLLSEVGVNVDGKIGPLMLKSAGTLKVSDTGSDYEGRVTLSHPSANDLRAVLSSGTSFAGKLNGPVEITANIKAGAQQTEVTNIDFSFGPYGFQAQAIVNDAVDPRSVSVSVSDINLDVTALTQTAFLPIPRPGDWSGIVTLAGQRLKSSLFEARDFSARYAISKNNVELSEWTGKLFEGRAQLALKWAKTPNPEKPEQWSHAVQGQVVVNDANAALVIPGLPSKTKGDLTFSFAAAASDAAAWSKTLGGTGEFHLTLPASATLKNTGVLAPLSAVVRAEAPDGRTPTVVESTGAFTMSAGVVSFNDLTVRANAYSATFGGDIDFNRDTFNLKGTLRLRDRGLIAGPSAQLVLPPIVPMTITGALQAPTIKMDVSQR